MVRPVTGSLKVSLNRSGSARDGEVGATKPVTVGRAGSRIARVAQAFPPEVEPTISVARTHTRWDPAESGVVPSTWTGSGLESVVSSPSCPYPSLPQQTTEASDGRAQV